MKTLIIILTFAFSLFAQHEWSEPVQISETGNSDFGYSKPVIVIDDSSIISVFWIKINYKVNQQIEWIQSADNGLSWTVPVNITPEFTDYSDERILDLRAICDSENNIYVFYIKGLGFDTSSVIYKKYNGTVWSEPDTLSSLASKDLQIAVDKEDRIYVFWARNGYQYYTYSDKRDKRIWLEPMMFEDTESNTTISNSNFVFDEENNLYVAGVLTGDFKGIRPGLFSYNKSEGKWKNIEEIGSFTSTSTGCALTLSSDSVLTANVSVGTTIDEGNNYIIYRKLDAVTWTQPVYLNKDTDIYTRKMFCDKNDNFHFLEKYVIDRRVELIYSYTDSSGWETTVLHKSDIYTYDQLDSELSKDKEKLLLVFREFELGIGNPRILFQTKLIETGIEETNEIEGYRLSQNYPNPFNSETKIQINLEKTSEIELNIYNSKGEFVKKLVNAKLGKGIYKYSYSAENINSGVYYYTLKIDGVYKESCKMLYLK